MSNYRPAVQWTRFRDGPCTPPRTDMKLMRKYHVWIDEGYVGDVHADDKIHARSRAIEYFNIQQDQRVLLTWDHTDEA